MYGEEIIFESELMDGCRLIRVTFPRRVDPSKMAASVARYLGYWDSDELKVVYVDVSRLEELDAELRQVLLVMLKRVGIQSEFLGSAWMVGDNEPLAAAFRDMLAEGGRDPRTVFHTETDSVDHLRARISRGPRT